jgi:ribosomal subunit interface protein
VNISYTGKQEYLHPKQKALLDGKLAKIAKLLEVDGKGDKNTRVALTQLKNEHRAEVTLNYLDHTVVGEHADADQFTALNQAFDKLERQMMRIRDKRRDVKKGPREGWDKSASADSTIQVEPRNPNGLQAAPAANGKPKVFRVTPEDGKPLTEQEAMLMIGDEPYIVYNTVGSGRLAVLIRRADANFDLVEC